MDFVLANQEYLSLHEQRNGEFRIARHHPEDTYRVPDDLNGGSIPMTPWVYGTSVNRQTDKEYNHRDILPWEVVFEKDDNNMINNIAAGMRVHDQLLRDGIESTCWLSGGKSLHVHVFFEVPSFEIEEKDFRRIIYDYYSNGETFDSQLLSRHLIRAEYGLHEKSMNHKEWLCGPTTPYINKTPSWVRREADIKLFAQLLKNARPHGNSNRFRVPSCINCLFNEEYYALGDGKKRALFVITGTFVGTMSKEALLEKVTKWNERHVVKMSKSELRRQVNNATTAFERGIHMSCRYRHRVFDDLGISYNCDCFKTANRRQEPYSEGGSLCGELATKVT